MYFIIKTGYGKDDFIRLDTINKENGTESFADLERAQGAFLTNSKTVFSNGEVCRGQDIIRIKEDWHKEMGWNRTYRDDNGDIKEYELGEDDWADIKIKGVDKKYVGILARVKEVVQFAIDNKKLDLIGKGTSIAIPERPKEISEGIKSLSDKFKI